MELSLVKALGSKTIAFDHESAEELHHFLLPKQTGRENPRV